MGELKLDLMNTGIAEELETAKDPAFTALKKVLEANDVGSDFLGWVGLPNNYDREEFRRIAAAAESIRKRADVLVVIGIGGSYLGARAVIEALKETYPPKQELEVLFAGNHLSSQQLVAMLEYLKDKEVCLNVISKSGTTTEPAIAFRFLKQFIEDKYGKEESVNRIYATTDAKKGALKQLANEVGYETFVVPDNIGGRYSVLTAVGLLPIACAGIDIVKLMEGAEVAAGEYSVLDMNNVAIRYAIARNLLHAKGKDIEILVNYEQNLHFIS